jgi:hypothetical protein
MKSFTLSVTTLAIALTCLLPACETAVEEILPEPPAEHSIVLTVLGDNVRYQINTDELFDDYILYLPGGEVFTLVLDAVSSEGITGLTWDIPTLYFGQLDFFSSLEFTSINGMYTKRRIFEHRNDQLLNKRIYASWDVRTWKPNIIISDDTPRKISILVESAGGDQFELDMRVELSHHHAGFVLSP